MKIESYAELDREIKAFDMGGIKLMVILGRPGLGKSYIVNRIVKEKLTFKGHTTPFRFVQKLYENPDLPVVIDDVLGFLKNRANIGVMLQLCELNEENEIFHDTTRSYEGGIFPSPFKSYHEVVVILNSLGQVKDPALKAVLNRGIILEFAPTRDEVLNQLRSFGERQVVDYMAQFKDVALRFDFRLHFIAKKRKEYGLDWKKFLVNEMGMDEKLVKFKELMKEYKTDKERITHYPWSERDYYRVKRRATAKLTGFSENKEG